MSMDEATQERVKKIVEIAHRLTDEIQFVQLAGLRNRRPAPILLQAVHALLRDNIIQLNELGKWNGGHQEDELAAVGLVNQMLARALRMDAVDFGVKYRSHDYIFKRARPDQWVPSLADQLKGARPVDRAALN